MGFSAARGTTLWLVLLLVVVPPSSAQSAREADVRSHPLPGAHRFSIRVGLLLNDHETFARVDSKFLGRGTDVEVERELGLDTSTRDLRVDASFRLGRRHQIQAGYLALSRSGQTSLRSSIQWGDFVFPVDVEVASSIGVELLPVGYRYAVISTERLDVGLSAGVFAMFLDAGVSAPEIEVTEQESADFPLPVIGADGALAVGSHLLVTGGVKYFAVRVDDIAGSWREIRGAVEYFPVTRLGIGVGFRSIRLEADGSEGVFSRPEGTLLFLDYRFSGPHLYVTLAL